MSVLVNQCIFILKKKIMQQLNYIRKCAQMYLMDTKGGSIKFNYGSKPFKFIILSRKLVIATFDSKIFPPKNVFLLFCNHGIHENSLSYILYSQEFIDNVHFENSGNAHITRDLVVLKTFTKRNYYDQKTNSVETPWVQGLCVQPTLLKKSTG